MAGSAPPAAELLRPGLLDGTGVLLAAAAEPAPRSEAVAAGLRALGADVARCAMPAAPGEDAEAEEAAAELAVSAALDGLLGASTVVLDACEPPEDADALTGLTRRSWALVRAAAGAALLPEGRGGRVVLIAPAHGTHATAAAAAFENLARTLSIEWARFAVHAIALAPGEQTGDEEIAILVAYLASPAGAYFSGCLLDLRGV